MRTFEPGCHSSARPIVLYTFSSQDLGVIKAMHKKLVEQTASTSQYVTTDVTSPAVACLTPTRSTPEKHQHQTNANTTHHPPYTTHHTPHTTHQPCGNDTPYTNTLASARPWILSNRLRLIASHDTALAPMQRARALIKCCVQCCVQCWGQCWGLDWGQGWGLD